MIRQIPVEEKATILASLVYIIALAFYKHWLHSQYDVMNGSLIERDGHTVLATPLPHRLLVEALTPRPFPDTHDLIISHENKLKQIINLAGYNPIFTTFVVLAFVAGTSAAAMS